MFEWVDEDGYEFSGGGGKLPWKILKIRSSRMACSCRFERAAELKSMAINLWCELAETKQFEKLRQKVYRKWEGL